ncbi:hypothetical protein CKO28_13540 [Rhodovibrio sodomensis]|uniref:SCO family protein n=1 Tax=Rhodovibrio sodomensis TaxID=1088 RepID=A0ABS1DGE2_9PROT|nr:SCO family protein [Rhodovibrio sodomensis]MBK1669056.1 hypothetical protein [Rhodovibrio sodomensis]
MLALRRSLIALVAIVGVVAGAVTAWVVTEASDGGAHATRGEAAIGGPFELVNTEGETVTDQDFRGRYMLLFFGFTSCPDVCPSALMDMSRALDRLADAAPAKLERVVPVFVTVDPARDDVVTMAAYVENFHPRLVGLTGTPAQLRAAADAFRVYHEKVMPETYFGGDAPERHEKGDYMMAHSAYMLLIGPSGGYVANFKHEAGPAEIAAGLREHVDAS